MEEGEGWKLKDSCGKGLEVKICSGMMDAAAAGSGNLVTRGCRTGGEAAVQVGGVFLLQELA